MSTDQILMYELLKERRRLSEEIDESDMKLDIKKERLYELDISIELIINRRMKQEIQKQNENGSKS